MKQTFFGFSAIIFCGSIGKVMKQVIIIVLLMSHASCTEFVEVDPPKNTLISKTVFDDPATIESALANCYYRMREQGIISGNVGGSVLMGIYSDELDYYGFDTNRVQLYDHAVHATNTIILGWWREAYKVIYAANDILKGLNNVSTLSVEDQARFKGQALFIRALMHSALIGLYGDIPYITTTNYIENNIVARMPVSTVYGFIIDDLKQAVGLLNDTDVTGEHVIPNKAVASALLARIYLYTENYELAELTAGEVISTHELESDITKVFLKDSRETLWQFKPNGTSHMNTYEANQFVIRAIPGQSYALTDNLLEAFEPNDLRYANWVGSKTSNDGMTTLYYPNKYKAIFSEKAPLEYSIMFRLSEQYLIRAEARTHLNDVYGAQEDLNTIRNRAGLENSTAGTNIDLLDAILQERRVELFTEQGHRWLDMKRMGKAGELLGPIKMEWHPDHLLLPIPETEIAINPQLKPQNSGY